MHLCSLLIIKSFINRRKIIAFQIYSLILREKNIFNLTGYCIRCIKMILDFMNIFISAPWDMVIIIKAPNFWGDSSFRPFSFSSINIFVTFYR